MGKRPPPRPRRILNRQPTASVPPRPAPAPPLPELVVLTVAASKPWYHDGLQFGCTACGACCRRNGYVWLSPPDIARLSAHLGLPVEEFLARYTHSVAVEGQDEPGIHLARAPHGCVFLDDATNACTVQEAKPTQCRLFPFWPMALESPEAWEREVVALCGPEALGQGPVYGADEIRAMAGRISGVGKVSAGNEPTGH